MPTHICGQCQKQFEQEQDYLNHKCPSTGFTPRDIEHQGPEFAVVSREALRRGEERLKEMTSPPVAEQTESPATTPDADLPSNPDEQVRVIGEHNLIEAVKAARKSSK